MPENAENLYNSKYNSASFIHTKMDFLLLYLSEHGENFSEYNLEDPRTV